MCSPLITASRPRGADRGGESLSREPAALGRAPGGGFDQGKAVSCHIKASGSGSGRRPSPHGLQDPRGATLPSLLVKIRYRAACWGYFSLFSNNCCPKVFVVWWGQRFHIWLSDLDSQPKDYLALCLQPECQLPGKTDA